MIDCENEIYTIVKTKVEAVYKGIHFTSEPTYSPAEFPCVALYEADNSSYDKTKDSSGKENHAQVMYEAYVFSNKKQGRKTECKNIFKVVDEVMSALGFTRLTKQPFNTDNVSRLIGRYIAIISKNKEIFRR